MKRQKGATDPVAAVVVLVILVTIAAFALPWRNIEWGKIKSAPDSVTVSGEAKSQQQNQIASFTAGINAINDKKEDAVKEVNAKAGAITEAVKKFGIPSSDIQTQNLSIYQNQESYYDNGVQKMRQGQWNVNNSIEITLRDVAKASELADILTSSGANNVYGPNFRFDDTSDIEKGLFDAAIKDARTKAEIVAKSSGRTLGKVINVSEGSSTSIFPMGQKMAMGGGGVAPVEPGSGTVSKTVTVSFELN